MALSMTGITGRLPRYTVTPIKAGGSSGEQRVRVLRMRLVLPDQVRLRFGLDLFNLGQDVVNYASITGTRWSRWSSPLKPNKEKVARGLLAQIGVTKDGINTKKLFQALCEKPSLPKWLNPNLKVRDTDGGLTPDSLVKLLLGRYGWEDDVFVPLNVPSLVEAARGYTRNVPLQVKILAGLAKETQEAAQAAIERNLRNGQFLGETAQRICPDTASQLEFVIAMNKGLGRYAGAVHILDSLSGAWAIIFEKEGEPTTTREDFVRKAAREIFDGETENRQACLQTFLWEAPQRLYSVISCETPPAVFASRYQFILETFRTFLAEEADEQKIHYLINALVRSMSDAGEFLSQLLKKMSSDYPDYQGAGQKTFPLPALTARAIEDVTSDLNYQMKLLVMAADKLCGSGEEKQKFILAAGRDLFSSEPEFQQPLLLFFTISSLRTPAERTAFLARAKAALGSELPELERHILKINQVVAKAESLPLG